MPSRRDLLATGTLLGSLLAGCTNPLQSSPVVDRATSTSTRTTPEDPPVGALVDGTTTFALGLHRELAAAKPNANRLTSPYSVAVALAMTYGGARGDTRSAMRETLGFPEGVHAGFNALDARVDPTSSPTPGDDGVPFSLDTVNAVWGQEDFAFRRAYLDLLARHYGAGVNTVDFREHPERARNRINEWVAGQTDGEVTDLMPKSSIGSRTRLVLTNAVTFEANWKRTFEKENTEKGTFTALDGTESSVPMMHQKAHLPHAVHDGTTLVEFPYVGDEFSMVCLLPPRGGFRRFEREVTAGWLRDAFGALEANGDVIVELPRFEFGSKAGLKPPLSDLGMDIVFDPQAANFAGIADGGEDLYVDAVVHEANIAVDEMGTKATAATGVSVAFTGVTTNPPKVVFDRPFLFAIRHRPTDAVLFLGRVVDAGA